MRARVKRTFVSLVTLGAAVATFATPIVTSSASEPRVVVAGTTVLPTGDVVVHQPITASIDVALRGSNPSALSAFLSAVSSPSSPEYRHFLTTAQFATRFGASPASVATVADYFKSFGLHVGALSKGRVVLHVSGTTASLARAFDTPIVTVRRADGALVPRITASATLPHAIAASVVGVAGLSSVIAPSPSRVVSRAISHATYAQTCPSAGSSTSNGPNALGGYTLQQQGQLYGLSSQWANGFTGAGQTIGVYELGAYNPSDLSAYFSCYGLNPTMTTVNVDGGPAPAYTDEATLDIEEAAGLAPGAAIKVFQGPNSNTGPTDTYQQIADDNTSSVITTSWGTCESDPNGSPSTEQPIFQQMAAQGQTIFSAAGDSGSSDCAGVTNNQLAVDDPASQPFVTGVGGLSVNSISPLSQTVWNNGTSGAGGGGSSVLWSRPSWQNAPGITASQTMRMVPDLSVMGDPGTGFIEYYTGSCGVHCTGWNSIGGTSIGSPLMSAMAAVGAQRCGVARLGFLNPTLYAMATTGFIDVTTGSNDAFSVGAYSAGVGYDMASGLGSPNPSTFFAGLCPVTFDLAKSAFSTTAHTAITNTAGPSVSALLKGSNGLALTNATINVSATGTTGRLVINGDSTSSQGNGSATYNVTTDNTGAAIVSVAATAPGDVTVTLTYQSQTVYQTHIVFADAKAGGVPARPSITKVTPLVGGFLVNVRVASASGVGPVTALQYSINGGRTWVTIARTSSIIKATGLLKAKKYSVVIRAVNGFGPGPASTKFVVVTRR